jgi:hypothetical protein
MICFSNFNPGVVDWHRFDAYRDPDPTFHFDAVPDPNLTPTFTYVGKSQNIFAFIHSSTGPHYFIFLVSVIDK